MSRPRKLNHYNKKVDRTIHLFNGPKLISCHISSSYGMIGFLITVYVVDKNILNNNENIYIIVIRKSKSKLI